MITTILILFKVRRTHSLAIKSKNYDFPQAPRVLLYICYDARSTTKGDSVTEKTRHNLYIILYLYIILFPYKLLVASSTERKTPTCADDFWTACRG